MAIGKWIGAFMGMLSGGPLGALAGFVIGALLDGMSGDGVSTAYSNATRQAEGERNGFLFALMVLSAHVIHADGKIMHSEMEYLRRFLRTNFNAQAESEGESIILKLFDQKKSRGEAWWNTQINAVCQQLGSVMPIEQRTQLVAFLCEIAKADGHVDECEVSAIRQLCVGMGLDANTPEQMLGLGGTTLDDAYKVLGVSPSATDDEVRKAYKRMALQHHPDRVANLGEDVRRAAERKFQEIGEAKDRIYKARNMR